MHLCRVADHSVVDVTGRHILYVDVTGRQALQFGQQLNIAKPACSMCQSFDAH